MKKNAWLILSALLIMGAGLIRGYRLTASPPSPYWEEVALGYDAYSLAQTGRDHHGNTPPLIALESFGDWKPSGYFFTLVPFIKTLGLNVFVVRLPSVLAGIGVVIGLGVLTWQMSHSLFSIAQRQRLAVISLGLTAISPWLIQFSRAAWEVNLATFFVLWGVICGWQSLSILSTHSRRFAWLAASIFLLFASMYTYHSARITAPILGLMIGGWFLWQEWSTASWKTGLKQYGLLTFLIVGLSLPFIQAWNSPALNQRLAETSIFSDSAVIEESNRLREAHGPGFFGWLMAHRFVLFGEKASTQFLDHFRPDFLFVTGDSNPRHSSQYFGLFYPFEGLFLIVGTFWIIKTLPSRTKQLLGVWLVAGILPAALSTGVPHALRILPASPVFLVTITFGIWHSLTWLKQWFKRSRFSRFLWPISYVSLIALYLFCFTAFYRHLLIVYPQQYSQEWQYGYQEMIEAVTTAQAQYPELPIYISRQQGRPAMYYWFYTQTDPNRVQQANTTSLKDQGEFLEFESTHFVRHLRETGQTPALAVGAPMEFEGLPVQHIFAQIQRLDGQIIWQVALIGQ